MTVGRIVVVNFVSLDGVVQSPLSADEDRDGGFDRGGWVPPHSDDVVDSAMREATVGASGLLLGRRSYEILSAAWADADPSEPAVAAMSAMPKHVVASGAVDATWPKTHVLAGDLPSTVRDLRGRTDGDLVVFGSAVLVRGLAERDLVDAYRLLQFPVIVGAGKRMFDERAAPAAFALEDATISPSGVAILTYVRRR